MFSVCITKKNGPVAIKKDDVGPCIVNMKGEFITPEQNQAKFTAVGIARAASGGGTAEFKRINKGAILTRFTATKGGVEYPIDCLSAHYPATGDDAELIRAQQYTSQLTHRQNLEIKNWGNLVAAAPAVRLFGADLNTRDHYVAGQRVGFWRPENRIADHLAISQLGQSSTSSLTYTGKEEKSKGTALPPGPDYDPEQEQKQKRREECASAKDKKRSKHALIDYAMGGSLDVVGSSCTANSDATGTRPTTDAFKVDVAQGEKRDHASLGSQLKTLQASDAEDFNRVRQWLGTAIEGVKPELAFHIRGNNFQETPANKDYLLKIYNKYVAKEAVIDEEYNAAHTKIETATAAKKDKPGDATPSPGSNSSGDSTPIGDVRSRQGSTDSSSGSELPLNRRWVTASRPDTSARTGLFRVLRKEEQTETKEEQNSAVNSDTPTFGK